jgi:hypothetical protein
MNTGLGHRIEFAEGLVQRNMQGVITHHPLSDFYRVGDGKKYHYGDVAFAGHDLDESDRLDDVRSYWLYFHGEPISVRDREAWADPLRVAALRSLCRSTGHVWYMAFKGDVPDLQSPTGVHSLDEEIMAQYVSKYQLPHTAVAAAEHSWLGHGDSGRRLMVEYPAELMAEVLTRYLPDIYPASPFEGYLMPAGQIHTLAEWNSHPRTDLLFRAVMDGVDMLFYTAPEEHRHFVFLTTKYTLDEMAGMLDLESLQQAARRIGGCQAPSN